MLAGGVVSCIVPFMDDVDYDLCVIGGGINGAGIARDAAGRGLRVLLVEAQDLAGATSSASSKMIHGGLRYLEYYDFGLVREALKEREILLQMAPHIVWPAEFVLPHVREGKGARPFWMIRAGLFLYDHLARRKVLKGSYGVNLRKHVYGTPLKDRFKRGFCYSDCRVDDARLVVLNALDAQQKGAEICVRTACTHLAEERGAWSVTLRDVDHGEEWQVRSAMVVNAAGPWVRGVLEDSDLVDDMAVPNVRLVAGSHIIVRQKFEGDHSYLLQQPDGRVVFVMPYEGEFTLIGTTEVDFEGDPSDVKISDDEISYLCGAYNAAFISPISPQDVVWSYSGVRPLFDDGGEDASVVTREYHLHEHGFAAPMISVFGGKLTTYRVLAEEVLALLGTMSGRSLAVWTAESVLPGGEVQQNEQYQWLDGGLLNRYLRSYGSLMGEFLRDAKSVADLGVDYGDGVYEAEIVYLIQREWARTLEDVLLRRTKLGLHVSEETLSNLEAAFPALLEVYLE